LLDNTYCSGAISADGHEWATTAIGRLFGKIVRGFSPELSDGMEDSDVTPALFACRFIWDNAIAHGKTLRDYGEFAITRKSWKDKTRKGEPVISGSLSGILEGTDTIRLTATRRWKSLRPYLNTNTVGWTCVPDIFRAAQFITN